MKNNNIFGALIVAVFLLAMINPLSEQASSFIGSNYSLFSLSSNWIDIILISIAVFLMGLAFYGAYESMKYS